MSLAQRLPLGRNPNNKNMEKATLHIKGQVAEVLENKGVLNAKIICDTSQLLISLKNVEGLELGGEVLIEGEIKINSVQMDTSENHQ